MNTNSRQYGIITQNGEFIAVGKTNRGAKAYATRNHYDRVGYVSGASRVVVITDVKTLGEWNKINL